MKIAEKDTISGRLKKRRASMTDRRKKQIVQNWLSSFVVTAVVVVAVSVSNTSTKTEATFTQLDTLGTEIFYEVSLLEPGDNVDPESLKVVAESQLGSRESKLSAGVNQGVFSSLSPNTEYTVSIVGSKGFGNFTIESRKVRTTEGSGGTILDLSFIEMSDQHMKYLDLSGTAIYVDNKNEYSSVYLEYQYFIDGEATGSVESISVTSTFFPFYIESLPYENGNIVINLFATLKTGGNLLLKQISLVSPFLIGASGYIDSIEPYSILLSVYPDQTLLTATYFSVIKQGDTEVYRSDIEIQLISNPGYQYYYGTHYIPSLMPETTYEVNFGISYTNPSTGLSETRIFQTDEVTTPPYYSFSATIQEVDTNVLVTITLFDPSNVLSNIRVSLFNYSEGSYIYVTNSLVILDLEGDNKIGIFENYLPGSQYKIEITGDKTIGGNIYPNQVLQTVEIIP